MTKNQKNITGVLTILTLITGLVVAITEYEGPWAMDTDITELREEIGDVREVAEANRLRMLYDDLEILYAKRDMARRNNNQALILELDERIRRKIVEIKNEEKNKSTG
ncbi:MAG: hypothetical protein V3R25_05755 [Nitrosomonadaceae bacterium]